MAPAVSAGSGSGERAVQKKRGNGSGYHHFDLRPVDDCYSITILNENGFPINDVHGIIFPALMRLGSTCPNRLQASVSLVAKF
jgi:hypothetical protein